MATVMISTRIDEELLAEIDTFSAAKDKSRTEAIHALLQAGLESFGSAQHKQPGWDAKEIRRIAYDYYGGMAAMFADHDWHERGSQMLPSVQRRVSETYGSVQQFINHHRGQDPKDLTLEIDASGRGDNAIPGMKPQKQRDYMRLLIRKHGLEKKMVCKEFSNGLRDGTVSWKSRNAHQSPEAYADAVWRDGEIKGWFHD